MIIKDIDKIPDGEFFVIVTNNYVTIPGDRRSREAPGHGFPEHTESYPQIEIFDVEEKFKDRLKEYIMPKHGSTKAYKAFKMTPVVITPILTV